MFSLHLKHISQKGFTLLEVMMALMVMALVTVSLMQMIEMQSKKMVAANEARYLLVVANGSQSYITAHQTELEAKLGTPGATIQININTKDGAINGFEPVAENFLPSGLGSTSPMGQNYALVVKRRDQVVNGKSQPIFEGLVYATANKTTEDDLLAQTTFLGGAPLGYIPTGSTTVKGSGGAWTLDTTQWGNNGKPQTLAVFTPLTQLTSGSSSNSDNWLARKKLSDPSLSTFIHDITGVKDTSTNTFPNFIMQGGNISVQQVGPQTTQGANISVQGGDAGVTDGLYGISITGGYGMTIGNNGSLTISQDDNAIFSTGGGGLNIMGGNIHLTPNPQTLQNVANSNGMYQGNIILSGGSITLNKSLSYNNNNTGSINLTAGTGGGGSIKLTGGVGGGGSIALDDASANNPNSANLSIKSTGSGGNITLDGTGSGGNITLKGAYQYATGGNITVNGGNIIIKEFLLRTNAKGGNITLEGLDNGGNITTTSGKTGGGNITLNTYSGSPNTAGNIYLNANQQGGGNIFFSNSTNASSGSKIVFRGSNGQPDMYIYRDQSSNQIIIRPDTGTSSLSIGNTIEIHGKTNFYDEVSFCQAINTPSVNPSAGSCNSDRRLKKNIRPLSSALDKILTLQPKKFKWKKSGEEDIGFIAQEVRKIYPEFVHENPCEKKRGVKKPMLSLAYQSLTAPIIKAIQEFYVKFSGFVKMVQKKFVELDKRFDVEDKKIEALAQKVTLLEKKLEALESKQPPAVQPSVAAPMNAG